LRAVIIGADGTPYHGGLFFFDFLAASLGVCKIRVYLLPAKYALIY